jgi:cold shock CspA family protein
LILGPGSDHRGTVSGYDEAVGLGTVLEERAGEAEPGEPGGYAFHCTQIADGSRSIEVGTAVAFRIVPGRSGRWEAGALRRTT